MNYTAYSENINPAASELFHAYMKRGGRKNRGIDIVEYGCATGALGHHLMSLYPNIRWHGYDYNPASLTIASNRLFTANLLNLNEQTVDLSLSIGCEPSLIVMVDLFEHLYEPVQFLKKIIKSFPQCPILCVLPNIACLAIIQQLSNNEFKYQDHGILDRTHRTFYTTQSTLELFRRFRFVDEIGPVFLKDPLISSLFSNQTTFPAQLSFGTISLEAKDTHHFESLCSYGFGYVFTPQVNSGLLLA